MAIGAFHSDAFFTDAFSDAAFLFEDAGVLVPDVVGETAAAAVATLGGVGFVAFIETAYSSTVPVDVVISQSPLVGVELPFGSTVTITVSLGDAPVPPPADASFTGGFIYAYEREQARRRRERKKRQELEDEAERIEEETSREIARLLHEQEAKDARRAELQRLSELVDTYARRGTEAALSERVQKAISKAASKQTTWALYALERELRRAHEEEEFLLSALRFAIEND